MLDCTSVGQGVPKAFSQESLKSVTSPTSVGLLTFWHTFFHIEICLRTGSRGTPLFYPLFYDRLSYLKQYRTFLGPKSGPNRWRRTHARTNGQTHIKNLRPPAQKPFGQKLQVVPNVRALTDLLMHFLHSNPLLLSVAPRFDKQFWV